MKFIFIGFVFATVVEFQFNILVKGSSGISRYIFTVFFYPVYLIFVYFSSRMIDRIFKKKTISDIVYYFAYGFIGMSIEWFVIGNSPWGNPDAIQIGMFAFWVALAFMPRIFIDDGDDLKELKRSIIKYYAAYAIISTVMGSMIPFDLRIVPIVLAEVIVYVLMNYFYIQYYRIKSKRILQ